MKRTCEICNSIFKNKKELDNHKKTHSIEFVVLENEETNSLNFIDLFSGIGGFHEALSSLGHKCVLACDVDKECRIIYERNYGIKPKEDITKLDEKTIPNFDILCAGFPCVAFSKSGHQKGFEDSRGQLFFDVCRIANYHKPKYMILENVSNLTSHDNGHTWSVIYSLIDELGYYTYKEPLVLNVLHFNIPQNRERVIILCKRKDLGLLEEKPVIPTNPKQKLTNKLVNIIEENVTSVINPLDTKMKEVSKIWDKFIKIMVTNNIQIPKFPIWTDWWDNDINDDITFYNKYKNWITKNREFYLSNKSILESWLKESRDNSQWFGAVRKFEWQAGDTLSSDGMNSVLWTARSSGIRVKRPDYIPTLVAMSHIPVYGPLNRKLIPRELLRLQSFPNTFQYNEKSIFKQVGNAVNVEMIKRCTEFLINNKPLFS